jgi:hypothetical protein
MSPHLEQSCLRLSAKMSYEQTAADLESSLNMLTADLKYFGFWLNAIAIDVNVLVYDSTSFLPFSVLNLLLPPDSRKRSITISAKRRLLQRIQASSISHKTASKFRIGAIHELPLFWISRIDPQLAVYILNPNLYISRNNH